MSYLNLARKYRPQKFGDLTGQETTAKILQAAIAQKRIAPAYLFSGPRGIGKTTTARIFAKALNCPNLKGGEPCDACSSCGEISRSASMDVLEMDAASHTQVENMREAVINTVGYAPARDPYKIFIIDEVHMLSNHSFNALLKTLEEPPPHAVFILATTEYHKIPATIASRCQRFRFLPLTPREILAALKAIADKEKIAIEEEALFLLAKAAQGSLRDALSLFDQVISHAPAAGGSKSAQIPLAAVESVLGVVREDFLHDFLGKIADQDARGVLEAVDRLLKEGYDLSYFLRELREAFRQMLVEKCGFDEEKGAAPRPRALPGARFSIEELLRAGQLLSRCADQMRWNDFPRLVFECAAVRLCRKGLDADDLLEKLERMEEALRGGPPLKKERGPGTPSVPTFAPKPVREAPFAPPSPPKPPAPYKEPLASGGMAGEAGPVFEKPGFSAAVLEPEAMAPLPPSGSPPEPHAAVAVEEAPVQTAVKAEADVWQRILECAHREKPLLYSALASAQARISGSQAEIYFSKAFSHDTAKRNFPALQKFFADCGAPGAVIILKIGPPGPSPVSAAKPSAPGAKPALENGDAEEAGPANGNDADTVVVETLSEAREELDAGEVFEPIDTAPSPVEDAIEDDGLKKFLTHFHGKITRYPPH